MLKVQNLYKKYRFKSGCTINLEFGSNGFVVLFSSNESGNKTLLNIIGGLEKFDSGDLLVNKTAIKSLTNKNLNNYRNNYIGYILEDIGLFSHLTVSENLALELELKGLTKDEKLKSVNETITKFNLQEIKNRKPDELSEKEKHKVKIAGAIAKDSKIILVDSKIDIEIMEILKELSKEKLVIVATNDDYIKQYCDRFIEFYNREIISDEIINEHNLGKKELEDSLDLKSISLYLKSMFNFTRKWMRRNYIMTLFLILITVLFGLATSYGRYDTGKVTAKTFYDNDLTELELENGGGRYAQFDIYKNRFEGYKEPVNDMLSHIDFYKETFTDNTYYEVRRTWRIEHIYDRGLDYYYRIGYSKNSVAIYDDIKQFESSIIYGDKITEITDVYITDYLANILVRKNYKSIDMESLIGEEITVNCDISQMSDMESSYKHKFITFTIAGIIDTDYEQYDYPDDVQNKYGKIITSSENIKTIDDMIFEDSGILFNRPYFNKETSFFSWTYIITFIDTDNVILLGNSKMPSSKDEVVIPLQYIIDIMRSEGIEPPTEDQLIAEQEKYLNDFIDRKFNFKYAFSPYKSYEKELTIVGLYEPKDEEDKYRTLILSDEGYKEIYYHNLDIELGIELGDDEKENIALFQSLDENFWHNTLYSDVIYVLEFKTNSTQEILYKIAFALVLIPVVKEVITRSSKAEERKKLNRTLQSKGINPTKFFVIRGLVAALITSVIGYLLLSVIMIGINLIITNMYNISYFLPYQSFFSILTVIVVALIIYLGAALKEIYYCKRRN